MAASQCSAILHNRNLLFTRKKRKLYSHRICVRIQTPGHYRANRGHTIRIQLRADMARRQSIRPIRDLTGRAGQSGTTRDHHFQSRFVPAVSDCITAAERQLAAPRLFNSHICATSIFISIKCHHTPRRPDVLICKTSKKCEKPLYMPCIAFTQWDACNSASARPACERQGRLLIQTRRKQGLQGLVPQLLPAQHRGKLEAPPGVLSVQHGKLHWSELTPNHWNSVLRIGRPDGITSEPIGRRPRRC